MNVSPYYPEHLQDGYKKLQFRIKKPSRIFEHISRNEGRIESYTFFGKKEDFNTRKLRKNAELEVRIELTTLGVLVRML